MICARAKVPSSVAPTIEFSCTHNVVRHLQKEGAYSIVLSGGYDDGKVLAMLMKFYQRVCLAFETFQCLKQL
ncbi:hypothetical protein EMCRGX_G017008 [Ephydatia muelleri]